MSNYSDGRRFEYKVRDALAADGYEIIRAAGSKGKVDLEQTASLAESFASAVADMIRMGDVK